MSGGRCELALHSGRPTCYDSSVSADSYVFYLLMYFQLIAGVRWLAVPGAFTLVKVRLYRGVVTLSNAAYVISYALGFDHVCVCVCV